MRSSLTALAAALACATAQARAAASAVRDERIWGSSGGPFLAVPACRGRRYPIKIGVTGPYTGGSSSMGVSMRDGVRLAAEEINRWRPPSPC
jgi:branched-chain amino acid transport system substrate-binding protein